MAITIVQPGAGAYVGQGMYVFANIDGPTLLDDYCDITVVAPALFAELATGRVQCNGGTAMAVQLGWNSQTNNFDSVAQAGAPIGQAVTITVAVFHAGGVLVETASFSGFFHDPLSGFVGLASRIGNAASIAADVAAVLASVRKTF